MDGRNRHAGRNLETCLPGCVQSGGTGDWQHWTIKLQQPVQCRAAARRKTRSQIAHADSRGRRVLREGVDKIVDDGVDARAAVAALLVLVL
eukprot:3221090-Rhodomonas_salina.1